MKIWKNREKSQKITFFQKIFLLTIFFSLAKNKNAIILVLQYKEDAIQPKLSSPACCRILGGYPELDGAGRSRTEEILVSNIGLYW